MEQDKNLSKDGLRSQPHKSNVKWVIEAGKLSTDCAKDCPSLRWEIEWSNRLSSWLNSHPNVKWVTARGILSTGRLKLLPNVKWAIDEDKLLRGWSKSCPSVNSVTDNGKCC